MCALNKYLSLMASRGEINAKNATSTERAKQLTCRRVGGGPRFRRRRNGSTAYQYATEIKSNPIRTLGSQFHWVSSAEVEGATTYDPFLRDMGVVRLPKISHGHFDTG